MTMAETGRMTGIGTVMRTVRHVVRVAIGEQGHLRAEEKEKMISLLGVRPKAHSSWSFP